MPVAVQILRWVLGIGSLVALGLFLLILTAGKGFEGFRSGSGSEDPVRELLPVAIPLLLCAILASVLMHWARGIATFGYVLGAAAPAVLWFGWDYGKMTHRTAETNLVTGLPGVMAEGASGLMFWASVAVLGPSGMLIWLGREKNR